MVIKSSMINWNITNKRIIIRADLNVSFNNKNILDEYKLKQILPTIDYILKQGGSIILLTHIGRPTSPTITLSTQLLIPWFKKKGYQIAYAATIENAKTSIAPITILENIRFFKEEQTHNDSFANQLATLGDFFIQDAFGTLHKTDTSITLLPKKFSTAHRSIGFLVEKEIAALSQLITNTKKPFILILGGAKTATKIPLIKKYIGIADTIIICPALAFTFLKSSGKKVGASLVDQTMLAECKQIETICKSSKTKLILPIDYQITQNETNKYEYWAYDEIPDTATGISIGKKSIALIAKEIESAKTIFCNGTFGFNEHPETMKGMYEILKLIARSQANTIIAGGDTVAAAHTCHIEKSITHVSTGGGATLAYLSGTTLPGLLPFKIQDKN